MKRSKLELAKEIFTNAMKSVKVDIELASAKTIDGKELSFEVLEVGKEVTIGEEVAPDGEYELEDGMKVIVVDGKISELIEKEAEPEDEPKDESEVTLEDDDKQNIVGLKTVLDSQVKGPGNYVITLVVKEDGTYDWQDATDYQIEMSAAGEAKDKVIKLEANVQTLTESEAKLKEEAAKKDELIEVLSKGKPDKTVIQAPNEKPINKKPLSRGEQLVQRYK